MKGSSSWVPHRKSGIVSFHFSLDCTLTQSIPIPIALCIQQTQEIDVLSHHICLSRKTSMPSHWRDSRSGNTSYGSQHHQSHTHHDRQKSHSPRRHEAYSDVYHDPYDSSSSRRPYPTNDQRRNVHNHETSYDSPPGGKSCQTSHPDSNGWSSSDSKSTDIYTYVRLKLESLHRLIPLQA